MKPITAIISMAACCGLMVGRGIADPVVPPAATIAPGSAATAPAATSPAPVALHYTMPMDGFIAINIDDKKTGKHVRRLIAEVKRGAGAISEGWDLKDDAGQYVPPGDYTWTAVARPPLKLTYEITVNNAGQPPWWAPAPGKGGGGWLADHTPPHEVCAAGDYMFMGAPVAESGHSMIATDLDGNKLWGQGNAFGGFLGVRRYAGDQRYAYMINGAGILRIDTKDKFSTQPVQVDIAYSRDLPGPGDGWGANISGAAIHDNRLYIAYNAPPLAWVQSTFTPDMVDMAKSAPIIRMARGKRDNYREYEYDEVTMFHATFLDGAGASSPQAYYGDAPHAGDLAGTLTVAFKQPIAIGSVLVQDASVKVYALKPDAKLGDVEPAADHADDNGGGLGADPLDEAQWIPLRTEGQAGRPAVAIADHGLMTTALRFKATRLTYALAMSRRFEDVAPQAERVFAEGQVSEHGGWSVERKPDNPITPS